MTPLLMPVYYDLGAIKLHLEGRQLVLTLFASIQVYFLHFWWDLKTVLVHSFVIKNISFSRLCCYSITQSTLLNILTLLNQIHHLLHISGLCAMLMLIQPAHCLWKFKTCFLAFYLFLICLLSTLLSRGSLHGTSSDDIRKFQKNAKGRPYFWT